VNKVAAVKPEATFPSVSVERKLTQAECKREPRTKFEPVEDERGPVKESEKEIDEWMDDSASVEVTSERDVTERSELRKRKLGDNGNDFYPVWSRDEPGMIEVRCRGSNESKIVKLYDPGYLPNPLSDFLGKYA